MFLRTDQPGSRRALPVRVSHRFTDRLRALRRGQSRVGCGAGAAARAGRADRPHRDHRREGVDQDAADQVRLGEPGTEAAHGDRRDVRRRGQHRRPGHAARGWDADLVRRGLRALHVGHAVAGVQLRARPPAGIGAARAPGRPGRTHRAAGRARPIRRSSTSTRCCARSTGTPNRAPPTGTPRSPASRCCARGSRRWPPRSAPRTLRR